MSFEAVSNIAQAEAQAKVTVAEAESKASRCWLTRIPRASLRSMPPAQSRGGAQGLSRQVSEKARAQAKGLSGELENQKALRARAEGRLEQAAALVVERIVNS